MSKKSIEFLEKISNMAYVPITEPARLVKGTFEQYFNGFESNRLSKSFKEREKQKVNTTDISIEAVIDEIVEEYCKSDPVYYVPSTVITSIHRDLDSISKTFDNVWFSEFSAIDRLHVAKKKLRKLFEEFIGAEVKPYEMDKLVTIGDVINFLDSKTDVQTINLSGVKESELESGMLSKSGASSESSSGASNSNHTTQYQSTPKMAIDKKKIEYVIGIDLGHGETSAAICPMQWDTLDNQLDPAKDLEMEPNRKVIPSAITITADGTAKIGTAAFDPNILKQAQVNVCFKMKPQDINGKAEKLMIRFMKEVYRKIRENNGGMLTDDNHLVYIATPSGWDKTAQELYLQMAVEAGLPMGGITRESRAAFVRAQHDPTANLAETSKKEP